VVDVNAPPVVVHVAPWPPTSLVKETLKETTCPAATEAWVGTIVNPTGVLVRKMVTVVRSDLVGSALA
jgi:hypothetical protein